MIFLCPQHSLLLPQCWDYTHLWLLKRKSWGSNLGPHVSEVTLHLQQAQTLKLTQAMSCFRSQVENVANSGSFCPTQEPMLSSCNVDSCSPRHPWVGSHERGRRREDSILESVLWRRLQYPMWTLGGREPLGSTDQICLAHRFCFLRAVAKGCYIQL